MNMLFIIIIIFKNKTSVCKCVSYTPKLESYIVSNVCTELKNKVMYKLNVLASARVVCNIMVLQVRGRTHRELYF
jgi:hypothetical protein